MVNMGSKLDMNILNQGTNIITGFHMFYKKIYNTYRILLNSIVGNYYKLIGYSKDSPQEMYMTI